MTWLFGIIKKVVNKNCVYLLDIHSFYLLLTNLLYFVDKYYKFIINQYIL